LIFKNKFDMFQDNLNDFMGSPTGIGRKLTKTEMGAKVGEKERGIEKG
jgi:hypothetical protein